jgi:protocatechuate 3,4-dioxygenase beta subunit
MSAFTGRRIPSVHGAFALALALLAMMPSVAAAQARCAPTKPDALGPFYTPNAPARDTTGRGLVVAGRVLSSATCEPIAGARIEWWSADGRGGYNDEHRASQTVGRDGAFRYETDFPGRYPGRPPHLHVRITAPGHRALVTQLYPRPGETKIDTDFVLLPD